MLRELAARVGSLVWIPLFVKMPSPPGDNPHVAHFLKMLDEPWETRYKVRGILTDPELFWRKIHRWLQEQGYELRPRYHSDWEPSWLKTGRNRDKCEDGYRNRVGFILDAVRSADGKIVTLKRVSEHKEPLSSPEIQLGRFFSSGDVANDSRNHCVPFYDVLSVPEELVPNTVLIVMPLLRPFDNPSFDTVGSAVDYFGQMFEGLEFMHQHKVAHRDCNGNNIMYDPAPMFPQGFHPVKLDKSRDLRYRAKVFSRTQSPPKYYLIDFGVSGRYDEINPMAPPVIGGDRTAPEHERMKPEELAGKGDLWVTGHGPLPASNPFFTDVYYMGNMIREYFLQQYSNFGFMEELVNQMVRREPDKRPTMDRVVEQFQEIRVTLTSEILAARVTPFGEGYAVKRYRDVYHLGTQVVNTVTSRVNAVKNRWKAGLKRS